MKTRGLAEYWGYNTIGFFAPHDGYSAAVRVGRAGGQVGEFLVPGPELLHLTVQELTGTADDITEQILATLAGSLASEPVQSLALLRSMLTHPDAAQAMREGAARYQAQISRPITADDAALRAAGGQQDHVGGAQHRR